MPKYEITDKFVGTMAVIKVNEPPFEGLHFTFGAVNLQEGDASATLSFDYTVVSGGDCITPENNDKLTQLTGDILLCIMEAQLDNNSVIYRGGVDE